ncbi:MULTISPECIES: GtrA family protein [unclassified Nocardioides]|uniref:GtrA family protein n=1 Tax=unclassified Nocardioides TaxID=2615069 RepID=UPI0009E82E02|nr:MULTISPECIES: GtrA family protein [unclassified Nocardioides]
MPSDARSSRARRLLPSREVLTFLAVGGAGYVVDVLAFNWLRGQPLTGSLDPAVSKVLAVCVAMVVTYLGNRLLTWRERSSDTRREVITFVVLNLIGLGIAVATLVLSHDVLGFTSPLADNISANIIGLGLGTAFRYWSYRRFVFTAAPEPRAIPVPVAPPLLAWDEPQRVHVVSGSYGAGHDAAAREIAERLSTAGHHVRTSDVVDLFPLGLGRLLRSAYFLQLRIAPGSWGAMLRRLEPGTWPHRLAARLLAIPGTRMLESVAGADLVISTHPFASQALGRLRATGRLSVPAVTYLTDASVHPLWVHPHIDLHLALHEVTAAQARHLGGRTTVIQPLLPESCLRRSSENAADLRSRLGLPVDADIALVVGGSEGVGDLERSALDIAATGLAVPVVVCGHNESLRRRLDAHPGIVPLGWRSDMPDLLRASSCVVQNAGGFTTLESLAAGVPLLSYRCLPGHGETNAAALEASGLAPWARDPEALPLLLARAVLAGGAPALPVTAAPDLVDALSGAPVAVAG